MNTRLACGVACISMFMASVAIAGDNGSSGLCAVSDFNGKIEAAGGFIDNNNSDGGRGHVLGVVSIPLGCRLGLQLDGGIGSISGTEAGGVAAHLFMRDPSSYLVGGYSQWGKVGDNEIWRVGGEVEGYFGNVSIEALAGYEETDFQSDDLFASIDFAYYATDNLRLSGGYARFLDMNLGSIGLEWMPSRSDLGGQTSFFVQAAVGDDDFTTVYGGVRFYFGEPGKSLIRRHREDDPSSKGIFRLIGEASAPTTTTPAAPPAQAAPPPPSSSSSSSATATATATACDLIWLDRRG